MIARTIEFHAMALQSTGADAAMLRNRGFAARQAYPDLVPAGDGIGQQWLVVSCGPIRSYDVLSGEPNGAPEPIWAKGDGNLRRRAYDACPSKTAGRPGHVLCNILAQSLVALREPS